MAAKDTLDISTEELLCPIRHLLHIFSGKWKMPIVCILSGDTPLRYSTIKRRLGNITNVMLSQSLKELESAGLIDRKQYNEVPPRVEYMLTTKGKSILPILGELAQWAIKDMKEETSCGVLCTTCQKTP